MKFQLLSSTVIQHQGRPISPMALPMGSLVSVTFLAEGDGRAVVREISVLAEPGDSFEFTGRVIHLDLHVELMVLEDFHDQKSYEIHFDRSLISARDNFREGANVTALIVYDGTRYKARTLTVNPSSSK
jgi:hypothetical protein